MKNIYQEPAIQINYFKYGEYIATASYDSVGGIDMNPDGDDIEFF